MAAAAATQTDGSTQSVRLAVATRRAGSEARRRRFGAFAAEERRRLCERLQHTRIESTYHRRRPGNGAEAAGQRHERGISAGTRAAHLARSLAFLGVMHRADLTRQQA